MSPKGATTTSQGRWYTWADEEPYVSVTTLLQVLNKPFLPAAARKVCAELAIASFPSYLEIAWNAGQQEAVTQLKRDAKAVWDATADLGTLIHAAVEQTIATGMTSLPGWDPKVQPFLAQWRSFVEDRQPLVLNSEVTVYRRQPRYAGTADLIVGLDGEIWLLDLKTGKNIYPDSMALQLAAYRHADFMALTDGMTRVETAMPKIAKAGVLHLRADGWDLHEMQTDDKVFDAFRSIHSAWTWQNVDSKHAVL